MLCAPDAPFDISPMMKTQELKFGRALLLALLAPFASFAEGDAKNDVVEGSIDRITLGKHWAGPELKAPESLKGRVVLLKIWGG